MPRIGFSVMEAWTTYYFCSQGAAKNPNDANEQEKLKKAAEDLRAATNAAASNALKKKLVLRLEVNMFSIRSYVWVLL